VDGSAHDDAEADSCPGRSRGGTTEAEQVAGKLRDMKLADAGAIVAAGMEKALYYYAFREHWRWLQTNNPLKRLLREVRRRARVLGTSPMASRR